MVCLGYLHGLCGILNNLNIFLCDHPHMRYWVYTSVSVFAVTIIYVPSYRICNGFLLFFRRLPDLPEGFVTTTTSEFYAKRMRKYEKDKKKKKKKNNEILSWKLLSELQHEPGILSVSLANRHCIFHSF